MNRSRRRRLLYTLATLMFVAVILLSATSVALAQISQNYNLQCWGLIADGGGLRTSGQYILLDSFGQQFAGQSSSSTYIVRSGYVQDRPGGGSTPVPPPSGELDYFPMIVRAATTVGVCSW